MAKAKKEKRQMDGLTFDSNEEYFLYLWIVELFHAGYVLEITHQSNSDHSEVLFPDVKLACITTNTKGEKEALFHVLNDCQYSYDYKVVFSKNALGIFIVDIHSKNEKSSMKGKLLAHGTTVYFDAKGTGGNGQNNTSLITFPDKRKMMWFLKGIMVNKFIPEVDFKKTFAPKEFFFTEKTKDPRKLKGKLVSDEYSTLEQFLNKIK